MIPVRGSQHDDLVPLHQPFETELRGFNRRQVLEHLESLDGRIAMVMADRDAALDQVAELSKVLNHLRTQSEDLRREADRATSRVERILATPMAGASARIQRIMWLATEEAAELQAHAESEAAARIARADQEIAELRARADAEIIKLRANASREVKSLLDHARRQRDQDESAQRELRAQVADEVAALEALRAEITTALASAHQLLGEALGQIDGAAPVPIPPVPLQRGAEGGTVYLLNTGTEERRSPRASR